MDDRSKELASFSQTDVEYVLERELALAENYGRHTEPFSVLLAGQPGAGKTVLSAMLNRMLHDDAFLINADEYRRFHPNYKILYREYGSDSVQMTRAFSGTVTDQLIQKLSDRHINLIIEGTGRTVDVPRRTSELLAGKGYRTELAVIAARPEISLCSTLLRFYQMNEGGTIPRATALEAHDQVVAALPDNLDQLHTCGSISRITIWDRELTRLYDSQEDSGRPSVILHRYWNRPWPRSELDGARNQLEELRQKEDTTKLMQTQVLDELENRLDRVTVSHSFEMNML